MLDIAIVGCGIGGLATASFLREQGHTVTVFDQFATPEPVGSGLLIQPVGQRVLAELGILGAVMRYGVKVTTLEGRNHPDNAVSLKAHYDARFEDQFAVGIHRGTLFSLLLDGARKRGAKIESGALVLDAVSSDEPYLRIEGGRQAGPFDLVIDAAGAGSPLTQLLCVDLPYGALWGVVNLPEGERNLDHVLRQRYVGTRRMAGVLPIGVVPGDPTPKAALFWSLKRSEFGDWAATDIAEWKAEATRLWPDYGYLAEQITSHSDMTFTTYGHGSLNKPWEGRLVHIGDAAHQSSPQLGQGANMALIDASILAETLRENRIEKALPLYAKRRLMHVKVNQLISVVCTPLYQSDRPGLGWLRDRLLVPASQYPVMQRLVSRIICGDLVRPFKGRNDHIPKPAELTDILREPGE